MKISKFSKLKKGYYKIYLDDSELIIHEEVILKRNLLIHKELNEQMILDIQHENNLYGFYDLAVKYLSHGFKSEKDVNLYLKKKNVDVNTINYVINRLKKEGYINDKVYTEAFIHDRLLLSDDGPSKIVNMLLNKGISKDIIDNVITIFNEKLQEERIKKIINKQQKMIQNKSSYVLKNKIMNKLISLGYSKSLVYKNVDSIKFDDSSLRQKEYDKLHKKLSSKYSGSELELKIKQKLYQKGFYFWE